MFVMFSFGGKQGAKFKHALEGMLRDMSVKALVGNQLSTANVKNVN
jgi:hypothetical protein